jgi:sucrose phosphorylase
MEGMDAVKHILERIYGKEKGSLAFRKIVPLIERSSVQRIRRNGYFSEKDVVLITYGDSLKKKGEHPLSTLQKFSNIYLKEIFSALHILPFYPFSSDDGFSVMDFFLVNPELGSWEDIKRLSSDFQLMFDLVINHVSAESEWFENYLEEKEGFADLAIEVDPTVNLSMVTRPRSLPLLTRMNKRSEQTVYVWTTFSSDQIDLNYNSINVLEKMVEVLLFYVEEGARLIRLDAIAYLWKEIGTPCIHLSQAHDVVKLFRKILDIVAPDVILITETNVPHEENISYFGDGSDEAQMVYNFTLPPLLFYSFVKEDASILSEWAKELHLESQYTTFFNFTASHDGIGVRPLEGILPQAEIDLLIGIVKKNNGNVSYKRNPDGSDSPYELNITYIDALLSPLHDPDTYHAQRFLASQAIQFVLPGVPATYIHSLIGSRNWEEGVKQTERARTINREKLYVDKVISELKDPESFRSRIFYPYVNLIRIRKKQQAFHPNCTFEILEVGSKVFAIARRGPEQAVYAFTNVSSKHVPISLSKGKVPLRMKDLFSGAEYNTDSFVLNPYQTVWLCE